MSRNSLRAAAMAGVAGLGLLAAMGAPAVAHELTGSISSGELRNLVSDLYGGDGISLDAGFHEAHFVAAGEEELNDLSQVLASNIGSFSFNSSVSSITFDMSVGAPVRSRESLGPLFGERASTIGRGHVNFAASYADTKFKQLDGADLHNLVLTLEHSKINEATGQPFNAPWDSDSIDLYLDLAIDQKVLAFYGTYGVTDRLDVGLIVPVVDIKASVSANAVLNTTFCDPALFNPANNFQCTPVAEGQGTPVHSFASDFDPHDSISGKAAGIGDVLLRAKYDLSGGPDSPIRVGLLAQVAAPTGDETDLLGTGSPAVEGELIFSGKSGLINPHLNVGYQYFTDDDLDRSNARYVAGIDFSPRQDLSFSVETLGRFEEDDDKFFDLAVGGKWAINGAVPVGASLLVPLNRDEGLRPDYVLTFGIESTF